MNERSEMRHEQCEPHRPFSLDAGDRAKKTIEEAEELAARREVARGPQSIAHHFGRFFKRGVYFVQDAQR